MNNNKPLINDIAAFLFWTLAEKIGIHEAEGKVKDSNGLILLNQPFTQKIVSKTLTANCFTCPQKLYAHLLKQVATEAYEHIINGRNIVGGIFLDELMSGRSPSAKIVNTAVVNKIPKQIIRNENPEIIGELCIRFPLPALVLSTCRPTYGIITVKNTIKALGFDFPMDLFIDDVTQADEHLYVLAGVFEIPAPDENHAKLWDKIIPNSRRCLTRSKAYVPNSTKVYEASFEW